VKTPVNIKDDNFLLKKVLEKIESFGIMKKRITFVSYLQKNGKLLIENTAQFLVYVKH
jgi:hypothetical protein